MTAPFVPGDRALVRGDSRAYVSGYPITVTGVGLIRGKLDDRDMQGIYRPEDLERIEDDQMAQHARTATAGGDAVSRSPAHDAVDRAAAQHQAGEKSPALAPVAVAAVGPVTLEALQDATNAINTQSDH